MWIVCVCVRVSVSKNITHINGSQLMHCNENFRKGYNKAEQIMPLGINLYHFISQALVKNICYVYRWNMPPKHITFRVSTCLYYTKVQSGIFHSTMGERYKISKVITPTHNMNSCCELCCLSE